MADALAQERTQENRRSCGLVMSSTKEIFTGVTYEELVSMAAFSISIGEDLEYSDCIKEAVSRGYSRDGFVSDVREVNIKVVEEK